MDHPRASTDPGAPSSSTSTQLTLPETLPTADHARTLAPGHREALPTEPRATFELSARDRAFTMIGVLLGLLLAALDQTIVATAGPAIQRDLHMAPSVYPWITNGYLLASTVAVPIWGKLSDLQGRRRILLAGILVFLAGSLACGLSPSTWTLIVARALQGLGSAALFTSALTIVADIFPPASRGRYQGLIGGCFALSSVVGPLVGGFLTDRWSWHWVFLVNLPIGALAVTFIATRMPALSPRHRGGAAPPLDVAGGVWLVLAVVPFLTVLSLGRTASGPIVAPMLITSAVAGWLFVRRERRAPSPLLDLQLFRNRTFGLGNLAAFLLGAAFLGAIVFLPLFMVNVVGLSATRAGLTVIPLTFGIVGGNVGSGQLVSIMGRYKGLMIGSLFVLIVGFLWLGLGLRADASRTELTLRMVVLGLGLGPGIPLYTLAIQNAVDPRDLGVATAAATFSRQIGSSLGVAVLGAVFAMSWAGSHAARALPSELAPYAGAAAPGDVAGAPSTEEGETARLQVDRAALATHIEAGAPPERRPALMAALDRHVEVVKVSLTRAVANVYLAGVVFAILALITTVFLPELPLRGARQRGGPPVLD